MKAIITKYIPCTEIKGSRIKASAEGVPSIYISYPHELSGEDVYKKAAVTLAKKQGWSTNLVGGGLPKQGGYAFCFDELQDVIIGMMHDIDIFYSKYREPNNRHYIKLKETLKQLKGALS